MILLEDHIIMLERLKCEIDILVRLAYNAEDSFDSFRINNVRKQFDCVSDVFNDIKRVDFFSN